MKIRDILESALIGKNIVSTTDRKENYENTVIEAIDIDEYSLELRLIKTKGEFGPGRNIDIIYVDLDTEIELGD